MIARVHDKFVNVQAHHRVESAVKHRLRNSAYYSLRRVSCELHGNVLRLGGQVPSYYEKQLAQCLALPQLGSDYVLDNRLEVIAR